MHQKMYGHSFDNWMKLNVAVGKAFAQIYKVKLKEWNKGRERRGEGRREFRQKERKTEN